MKKKVLSLVLSLVMAATSFAGMTPPMTVSAEETIVEPAAKYSTGAETAINNGAGALVESDANVVNQFKNLEDFTMNAKFKVTGTSGVQTLFFVGDSTKNPNYVSVWISGSDNKNIGVESYNAAGSKVIDQNSKTSSVVFNDQEEHTFTYRHDKDGNITFYIDGNVAWSGSANNLGFTEGLFAEGATMYMGMGNGNRPNGGNNYPFTGTLKDVEIYTSAISDEQVAAYHAKTEDYKNLVYKVENFVEKTALTDSADLAVLKALESGAVSICYRVDSADAGRTTLFALTDANGQQYFEVYVNPAENKVGAMTRGLVVPAGGKVTDYNEDWVLSSTHGVDIQDTNWHVLTVRKGIPGTDGKSEYNFFVDGVLLNGKYTKIGYMHSVTDADTISIGSLKTGSADSNSMKGAIDSVRVYSGTLTNEEIAALAENLVFEADKVDDMTDATKTEPESLYYRDYDGSVAYRIPSLLKTKNGTVLAFIDQRNSGAGDSGNIDLMVRRREAGATSFDEGINIVDLVDNNNQTPCAFMIDACTLQDRETGRIFLVADMFPESSGLMNSNILSTGSGYKEIDGKDYQMVFKSGVEFGTIREDGVVYDVNGEKTEYTVITECEAPYKELGNLYKNGEYAGNIYLFSGSNAGELNISRAHYLWLTYSDDDGKTWSLPKDITPQIKEDWMLFIGDGPGVGLQLQDGTLTFPVYTASTNVGGSQSSALIYSTDGGESWTLGESPVKTDTVDRDTLNDYWSMLTESQAIQLQNGYVKLFMRNTSGKVKVATSTDGGKTWDKVESTPIYDAYCQLSVINYVKDDVEYVVVSNSGGPGRNNGTITLGEVWEDGSINWTHSKMFKPGSYVYSCLTKLGFDADGDMCFGLLYEDESKGTGNFDINYTEFDERWIRSSKVDAVQQAPKVVDYSFEKTDNKVTIEVTFDQTVMAAGEVGLKLSLAGNTGLAVYKDGSGSNTLTFEGTIPSGTGVLKVTGIDTESGYLENTINQEPVNVAFDLMALNKLQFVDAKATSQHSASTAENTDGAAINAIDGNPNTYWHSIYNNAASKLPQSITMELEEAKTIYKFVYTPRQNSHSGRIKDYELAVSVDGEKFETVATGTFTGGVADETVEFAPVEAKYVKLTALTATVAGSCNMAEAKVYEYANGVYEVSGLSVLGAEIAKAEAILESENNYSEATLETLQEAVAQVTQYGKAGISVEAEAKLVDMLKKSMEKLVDTTRGLKAIEEAEELLNSETVYTDVSKYVFEMAIEEAQTNLDKVVTVKDVTDIVMKLKYEASLLKEVDPNQPENPPEENLLKAGSISATEATVTEGQPFEKGTAGSNIFRIPCLITLKDEDHEGTLVAAADARYTEYRDFGGIDTIASVSKDGGKTWNYSFPIYFPDSNGSAAKGEAATAIDPVIVEGPDGTIYCFADMNPTGITTMDIYPGVGTGFVKIDGVERLALTRNYTKPNANDKSSYGNPEDYEYYVGDFDKEGFAPVLNKSDNTPTKWGVDEWYNIYIVTQEGKYIAALTQRQVNSDTVIQQNAFYEGSMLHVYNTGYIWCVKSYDGGLSWEDPEILNTQIKRDNGQETALLVSPGQGIVTRNDDIIVGAYDTAGGENASIFYSTNNGKTWKRSNDINVTSSENEIVELPDGTLRMFYRSQTGKICYADITRQEGEDGEVTYTIGEGKQTAVASNSNCNVSAILLEDHTLGGKPVILASNPEAPVSWTRVNGKIFVFTLNEDNTMNHEYTYEVNEGQFAYSCMTELDNGNIGMLWEPGINEASAIRYDEIDIKEILKKIDDRDIPVTVLNVTAGDSQSGEGPERVLDNKADTLWHTDWHGTSRENHYITFELKEDYLVDGLRYQPRQDGSNGNITEYEIQVSNDGENFTTVAEDTWRGDASWKSATFEPQSAKYVRLVAVNAVTDSSYVFASAAEIRLTGVNEEPQ